MTPAKALSIPRQPGLGARLDEHHLFLDRFLAEARRLLFAGDLDGARVWLDDFASGLSRHIRFEEEVLFPLFDRRVRMVGPTQVMAEEHGRIQALLATLRAALDGVDAGLATAQFGSLVGVLGAHNWKEERILHPKLDAALGDDEQAELIERFLAWR